MLDTLNYFTGESCVRNYNNLMAKQFLLAAVLLLTASAVMNDGAFATCPSGGVPAVAGKLTINAKGDVPLVPGTDVQCYNYTLKTPFDCAPSVAIGTYFLTQV